MSVVTRRDFFQTIASGAAVSGAILSSALTGPLRAKPLGLVIGCQTYPVRKSITTDFPGTIKQLAGAGFESVELCSPVGYEEFAPVGKLKPAELKKILTDAGVSCFSCHFSIDELRKDAAGRIAWAKDIGLTQMMVPTLSGPRNPTLDDVKRAAEEYNKIAEKTVKAGMVQGLHNEGFELSSVDGKRTYDLLFDLLDPKLVQFQFQVSTISRGYDAAEYFEKYPGRFISMHVQGWSSETKKQTPVGKGTLDWKKIFTAAKTGGIKNYYVEMAFDLMKESVPYLRALDV